jgi:hypothetical protein
MLTKSTTARLEKRQFADLRPFPNQARLFDDPVEHEVVALAHEIRHNGLREPIEVLPKKAAGYPVNTVLSDRWPIIALGLNGETETNALIRDDLAGADVATIAGAFLKANQHRLRLDPLAKVRFALRQFERERDRKRGKSLNTHEERKLRKRIGRLLGMYDKTVTRCLAVLKAPIEIQNALHDRDIKLAVAARVAGLHQRIQAEIAQRIRYGEPARNVVREYIDGVASRTMREIN